MKTIGILLMLMLCSSILFADNNQSLNLSNISIQNINMLIPAIQEQDIFGSFISQNSLIFGVILLVIGALLLLLVKSGVLSLITKFLTFFLGGVGIILIIASLWLILKGVGVL